MELPSASGIILPQSKRQNTLLQHQCYPPKLLQASLNPNWTHLVHILNPIKLLFCGAPSSAPGFREFIIYLLSNTTWHYIRSAESRSGFPKLCKLLSKQCPRWPRVAWCSAAEAFSSDYHHNLQQQQHTLRAAHCVLGTALRTARATQWTLKVLFFGPCSQRNRLRARDAK